MSLRIVSTMNLCSMLSALYALGFSTLRALALYRHPWCRLADNLTTLRPWEWYKALMDGLNAKSSDPVAADKSDIKQELYLGFFILVLKSTLSRWKIYK